MQALLLACEKIDVDDASHPSQETNAWLEEYLLEKLPANVLLSVKSCENRCETFVLS